MTIQSDIHHEVTDTMGGEANYSWVKKGKIISVPGQDYSQLAAVRRVKKAIGWNGIRCETEDYGDMIKLIPRNMAQVCFITFHEHGSAS